MYQGRPQYVQRNPVPKFSTMERRTLLYKPHTFEYRPHTLTYRPHSFAYRPYTVHKRHIPTVVTKDGKIRPERRRGPTIAGRVQKPIKRVVRKTDDVRKPDDREKDRKVEVKKTAPTPSESEKPRPEKVYELNPLLKTAVETELETIMEKVHQQLSSEEATNNIEEFVIDMFQTETAEYLENAIGLNVTKRLLDIYNDLCLDVQFQRKPQNYNLKAFIRAYNPLSVKRMKDPCLFRVQVRKIKDFDWLCKTRIVTCGDLKAKVTPCYKFTVGPPILKSEYKDYLINADIEKEKEDDSETNDNAKETKVTIKTDDSETNVPIEDEISPVKDTENTDTVKTEDKLIDGKTVDIDKTVKNIKQEPLIPVKYTVQKVEATKTAQSNVKNIQQSKKVKASPAKTQATEIPVSINQEESSKTTPAKNIDQTPKVQKQESITKTTTKVIQVTPKKTVTAKQVPNKIEKPTDKVENELKQNVSNNSNVKTAATQVTKAANAVTNAATTVTKAATPVTKTATTVVKAATTIAKAATPVTKTATTVVKAATTIAKAATPVTKTATTVVKAATPIAKAATPVTKTATTVVKAATPIAKAATPVTKVTTATNKSETPKPLVKQTTTKKHVTPKPTEKPDVKAQNKVAAKIESSTPRPIVKKPIESKIAIEDDLDDNEELTDEDILALMKEAIVLDECSGSDDEE